MSPFSRNLAYFVWDAKSNGVITNNGPHYWSSVRPVVTLSPEVQITGGDSSEGNFYQLAI